MAVDDGEEGRMRMSLKSWSRFVYSYISQLPDRPPFYLRLNCRGDPARATPCPFSCGLVAELVR